MIFNVLRAQVINKNSVFDTNNKIQKMTTLLFSNK